MTLEHCLPLSFWNPTAPSMDASTLRPSLSNFRLAVARIARRLGPGYGNFGVNSEFVKMSENDGRSRGGRIHKVLEIVERIPSQTQKKRRSGPPRPH
jgi:hypothetical protein